MPRNVKIISVPRYSFISSESGLLFSRSSTQTCEVKIPILLRKKKTLHIVSKLSSFLLGARVAQCIRLLDLTTHTSL